VLDSQWRYRPSNVMHAVAHATAITFLMSCRLLNLDLSRVNAHGGAVALGHPIGSSGARIIGKSP
jgi:acetyl-CoA C-acetyltransferase